MIFVFDRVENMGQGENAAYQHFFLFPKGFLAGLLKVWIVW